MVANNFANNTESLGTHRYKTRIARRNSPTDTICKSKPFYKDAIIPDKWTGIGLFPENIH
jgi:hypothetical protein